MTTHEEPTLAAQATLDHGTTAGSFGSEPPILFEAPDDVVQLVSEPEVAPWLGRLLPVLCDNCGYLTAGCPWYERCTLCCECDRDLDQEDELGHEVW